MAYFVFDGHDLPLKSFETCPAKDPDRIIVTQPGSLSAGLGLMKFENH